MDIMNIADISAEYIRPDDFGLATKALGTAGGSEKIYVNIDTVPPKAYSTKYHSHTQQEEFFLILSGAGTGRLDHQEYPVKKGDFFAKPAARGIAHTFFNSGDTDLVILDIGTVEKEDTLYYPDEDVYLQKSNGQRRVFSGAALDTHWTSEPNNMK